MATILMILIHLTAVLFFLPALIITIPLHLILVAVSKNKSTTSEKTMTYAQGWAEIKADKKGWAVMTLLAIGLTVGMTKLAIAYL